MRDISNSHVADILEIQRILIRTGSYADEKRWREHQNLFADEVTIDFGGVKPSQTLKSDDLRTWSERAFRLVRTQHMFMSQDVRVDGDDAVATSYGRALHQRTGNGESWDIYARYEHSLVRTSAGWKVTRLRMEPTWQSGNPKLLEEATAS